MVDSQHADLSVRRQCELLGLSRASFYYQAASESALNLQLIRLIDEQFLCTPFYGWRKMTAYLRRLGYAINGKRVRRLMRLTDIHAIYPRRSSSPDKGHKRYPYLCVTCRLRMSFKSGALTSPMCRCCGASCTRSLSSTCTAATCSPGSFYNTLDGIFGLDALHKALSKGRPKIFNTD